MWQEQWPNQLMDWSWAPDLKDGTVALVVFLGKTIYCHSSFVDLGVPDIESQELLFSSPEVQPLGTRIRRYLQWTTIPSRKRRILPVICQEN